VSLLQPVQSTVAFLIASPQLPVNARRKQAAPEGTASGYSGAINVRPLPDDLTVMVDVGRDF
jgi:hypothetical protein